MRAISYNLKDQLHPVDYYGLTIFVPTHAEYLATDEDGKLYWYSHKPRPENSMQAWVATTGASCLIGEVDREGLPWKLSLQHRIAPLPTE